MCKDLNQPIAKHDLINLETMLSEGKLDPNYNLPTSVTIFFPNRETFEKVQFSDQYSMSQRIVQ